MLDQTQLNRIQDPEIRRIVQLLANHLEQALNDLDTLRAENQRLKDEINRLKGEQGKPNIKPNKKTGTDPDTTDHSSEKQRKEGKPWSKDTKNDKIAIDRTEIVPLDPTTLPEDAVFKGYEEVLIQNLLLKTDNVCFKRATYYSASAGKTYLAPLPPGYEGGFGPDLKALVLSLHHLGNVSQPALHTFLTHAGIRVSTGWIGDFLIAQQEDFHQEKAQIGLAGLASSPWVGTDDTATRVNGVNQHCHVLTNPLFTTYTTLKKKDRRAVLTVLHNGQPVPLVLTPEGLTSEAVLSLPAKWQRVLATWPLNTLWEDATVSEWLDQQMPTLSATARKSLLDTLAIAGYHFQTQVPVVRALVCDDAPQFPGLTADLGLCWVHDGRHYRKLVPHLPLHRQLLDAFLKDYWTYYDRLLAYRAHPSSEESQRLRDDFDTLFSPDTGYAHLDFRIQQTRANKDKLLQVLSHPEIPLHNNASELAVRRRVRKRDVSFGARSEAGVRAWDTFQTLAATAQKLGVSFIAYVADRVSGRREMPSLASLITERASQMDLGASWA
jgi:hypothetical protein